MIIIEMRTLIHKANFVLTKTVKIIKGRGFKGLLAKIKEKVFRDDFKDYQLFIKRTELTTGQLALQRKQSQEFLSQPLISIITPVYKPSIEILTSAIKSCLEQSYLNWELCLADASNETTVRNLLCNFQSKDKRVKVKFLPDNQGIASNSNKALEMASGEFIAFLDHDDSLAPNALFEVVSKLNEEKNIDIIYSDEDKISFDGKKRFNPYFKPDWSPEFFNSYNYINHLTVVRRNLIESVGSFRTDFEGAQDYDLFLRVIEKTEKIAHIPKVLYHWRVGPESTALDIDIKEQTKASGQKAIEEHLIRSKLQGKVEQTAYSGIYRIRYEIASQPKIDIIVPTRDQAKVLKSCIDSVLSSNYQNFEITIVNNQSQEKETYDYFAEISKNKQVKILDFDQPFNFSALNNFAVKNTSCPYLLFLNSDTKAINDDWLESLISLAQLERVGAVGAKLIYHDEKIQHAGVIVGGEEFASHAFAGFSRYSTGYFGRLVSIQNYSALTAACLLIGREIFDEVGGFDEKLAIAFNDVDLCLKIRQKGYRLVWTPYAQLFHYESYSRGLEEGVKKIRFEKELEYCKQKWSAFLEVGDPYYNPNLSLKPTNFKIRV